MIDHPEGWEDWMGDRPDLSVATWWDLWYAITAMWDRSEGDGPFSIPVPYIQRDSRGRGTRTFVTVPWFWANHELQDRRRQYHEQALADIRQAHTRELLKWLQCTRRFGGWYSPCERGERQFSYHEDDIRAELANREHVPNKVEARGNRREAALTHRRNKLRPSVKPVPQSNSPSPGKSAKAGVRKAARR